MAANGKQSQAVDPMFAPFAQEAEQAVIGAVLTDGGAFHEIAGLLEPRDFYILRHEYIWHAFKRLHDHNLAIDFVSVQDELRAMGHLEDIGGVVYLLETINNTPTSVHADLYARLVLRAAIRRRMLKCADELKSLALDESKPIEKVIAEGERSWTGVRSSATSDDDEQSFSELITELIEDVEARMEAPEKAMGVPTGIKQLDALTVGLQKSDLIIIAARPGVGKTSFLLTTALNAARAGFRVGILSQEMNRKQVVARFAAMEAGIDLVKLRFGQLNQQEYARFIRAAGVLGKLPIYVNDANRMTPPRILSKGLRWKGGQGLDLMIVDYLQILSSGGLFRSNERTAEVSYFAMELKQIARELNIPVYAAAQLNRDSESRQDKRPMLSDLKESGTIEQEADIVQFIYRDVMYNEATEFPDRAEIIVAKHRNGATGTVYTRFEKQTTRFTDFRTQAIDLVSL